VMIGLFTWQIQLAELLQITLTPRIH